MISYGMYLSTTGALTSLYRQDVITNNLANAQTPGFKADVALQVSRQTAREEDGLGWLPSNEMLERLGGGAHLLPNIVSFAQGTLEQTDRPLDLAIRGDGFFMVREVAGAEGSVVRLTRDGRFTRRDDGTLVTIAGGQPVLDDGGRPIRLPPGAEPEVQADGTITQDGAVLGRLALVDVEDRGALKKVGGGLFAPPAQASGRMRPATGRIESGYLEQAGVDEISAMMAVAGASRAVQANLAMVSYHDRAMEQAVRTLGRVA